jgi:hypothetical protein
MEIGGFVLMTTILSKAVLLRLFVPFLISAAGISALVATLYHDLPGFLAAMFLR